MRKKAIVIMVLVLIGFVAWRFIRPMNIFVVDERFAWPVDTSQAPAVLGDLSARRCADCHGDFYNEWQTTIHSQAWTDPYFQTDWQFEGKQHSCRLCHTPLDRQQPQEVLGYRDVDRWDPILAPNPHFDPELQHEGVTCAACHYRDGKILGVHGVTGAPHPVRKLDDPNRICLRCHIVEGDRWDTFFRFPPCGTVAEIENSLGTPLDKKDLDLLSRLDITEESITPDNKPLPETDTWTRGESGEVTASDTRELGCVQCHMPAVERPLVEDGEVRPTRAHLWRGGHDPAMVKKALTIEFVEIEPTPRKRRFRLILVNSGAAHYVPTGTPDRHLTVHLRLRDAQGNVLEQQDHRIKRTVMWRPFIIDLWDTRLPRWQPRQYELTIPADSKAARVEAEIRYHLLAEARRERINYQNETPINYELFRKTIPLNPTKEESEQ